MKHILEFETTMNVWLKLTCMQIGSQAIEKPQIALPFVSWLVVLVQN